MTGAGRLTTDGFAARAGRDVIALQPLGALEAHGAHLPLDTDNVLAEHVAEAIARELDACLVLPTLPYGQVWSTSAYPGTISLRAEVLADLLFDVGASLHRHGIGVLAIVNAHMGNLDAMKSAARRLHDELGLVCASLTYPGMARAAAAVLEAPRVHPTLFHADELETSLMLHVAPERVAMDRSEPNLPALPPDFDVVPTPWDALSPSSVLGDPTRATAAKGAEVLDAVVAEAVALLGHVRRRAAGGS